MHHHEAVLGHLDGVAGHRNQRRGRRGEAEHAHVDFLARVAQAVVDRQPSEHIAAWAVDFDAHAVALRARKVIQERLCRHAERADVVEDRQHGGVRVGLLKVVPGTHVVFPISE